MMVQVAVAASRRCVIHIAEMLIFFNWMSGASQAEIAAGYLLGEEISRDLREARDGTEKCGRTLS